MKYILTLFLSFMIVFTAFGGNAKISSGNPSDSWKNAINQCCNLSCITKDNKNNNLNALKLNKDSTKQCCKEGCLSEKYNEVLKKRNEGTLGCSSYTPECMYDSLWKACCWDCSCWLHWAYKKNHEGYIHALMISFSSVDF